MGIDDYLSALCEKMGSIEEEEEEKERELKKFIELIAPNYCGEHDMARPCNKCLYDELRKMFFKLRIKS